MQICQLGLQFVFPNSGSIVVASSGIAEQQQVIAWVAKLAKGFPPVANAGDGKARRVMRDSQTDVALIIFNVINSIRRRQGVGILTKIMCINFLRLPSPRAARVFKVPYEFLLFGVGADNGMSLQEVFLLLLLDIFKLFVSIWMWWSRETLATSAQCKVGFFKRRPIVSRPIWYPLTVNWEAKAVRLQRVHFFLLHGSPAVFGSTNFDKSFSILGYLTSTRGRPAPGRRTRIPRSADGPALISRLPRIMVLGCMPVNRDMCTIPPWPRRCASRATQ